ncbi:sugar ABC transporter substrate-binding protein [Metabacillus litoralis]|uniref:sugar ABC transporter substrate-binding protein n=1 Tax=Metabacillus litoralis TaxID=152268 RepID=UPI00203CC6B8|nr:sugar ABC transporter substrate-binding protein [Metabacillus litoralis]MCM3653371.1 sugar ABC transporter substrate-binding protein [Metabacillus litoralis]
MKQRTIILFVFIFSTILIAFILKQFENEKPKVVVVLKELNNNQFWNIVKEGAEKGFRDFGIDGKVIAPSNEYNFDEQEKILKDILKENPDVLIVSLIEASKISILKEFDKNNIPVLLIDTDIPWENKTSYIGTNNLELGLQGGALLATKLQPGDKVALITGEESNPELRARIKGAKTNLENVEIKIATHKTIANDAEQAKGVMETILNDHPDVKGVYATSDVLALSAIEIIEKNGFNIPVVGTDGLTEMIELIEEGTLSSTVAQNPYDMGYLSVEAALRVVKGEYIERNINSGVDIIIQGNATQRLDFTRRIIGMKHN